MPCSAVIVWSLSMVPCAVYLPRIMAQFSGARVVWVLVCGSCAVNLGPVSGCCRVQVWRSALAVALKMGKRGGGAEAPFGMPGMQGRKRPPSHSGRSNGGKPSKISQLRDRATKAEECAAEAERRALALEAERSAAQQRAELAEKQAAEAERRATAAEAERSAIQQHAELADKQAAELRSRLSELERQLATAEAEARENKELVVHIAPRPASWPL